MANFYDQIADLGGILDKINMDPNNKLPDEQSDAAVRLQAAVGILIAGRIVDLQDEIGELRTQMEVSVAALQR